MSEVLCLPLGCLWLSIPLVVFYSVCRKPCIPQDCLKLSKSCEISYGEEKGRTRRIIEALTTSSRKISQFYLVLLAKIEVAVPVITLIKGNDALNTVP